MAIGQINIVVDEFIINSVKFSFGYSWNGVTKKPLVPDERMKKSTPSFMFVTSTTTFLGKSSSFIWKIGRDDASVK